MADLLPGQLATATTVNSSDILIVQNNSTGEVDQVPASALPVQGTPQTRLSNPYKLNVFWNGSFFAGNSFALTKFDSVDYDTGSNYNATTGLFTAPASGFYDFYAQFQGSSTQLEIQLQKNTTIVIAHGFGPFYSTPANNTAVCRTRTLLAAGDTVGVYIYSASNPITCTSGLANSYFQAAFNSKT